jgi:hypothetical protein
MLSERSSGRFVGVKREATICKLDGRNGTLGERPANPSILGRARVLMTGYLSGICWWFLGFFFVARKCLLCVDFWVSDFLGVWSRVGFLYCIF